LQHKWNIIKLINERNDIVKKITIFDGIEKNEIDKIINIFGARKISFNKDSTIVTNINNINIIGILLEGSANVVRYEANGNRNITEKLNKDDLFGEIFTSDRSNEISIIATSYCEVLFIDYNRLIVNDKKTSFYQSKLVDNMLQLLSLKIVYMNERIEVLTQRTIRDKLLTYFDISIRNKASKTLTLPFSFTDLADFLSVDRSAMTREIKKLKDEGFILVNNKRITLLY